MATPNARGGEHNWLNPEEMSLAVGFRTRSIRVFGGSKAAAAEWMLSRPPALEGKRIIEVVCTRDGLILAHRILDEIESLNPGSTEP